MAGAVSVVGIHSKLDMSVDVAGSTFIGQVRSTPWLCTHSRVTCAKIVQHTGVKCMYCSMYALHSATHYGSSFYLDNGVCRSRRYYLQEGNQCIVASHLRFLS